MVNLYFYVPNYDVSKVLFSGLSLAKWGSRTGYVMGGASLKRCIVALLNPKDDMLMYKSPEHACVKLAVPSMYCGVADNYLFEVGKSDAGIMEMYWKNIIPVEEYKFGVFIKPEAIITATVIPGRVALADKKADAIDLTGGNRDLYLSNFMDSLLETNEDAKNELLYYYYKNKAASGKYDEIQEDNAGRRTVFINSQGLYVTLDRPVK
jgi:hypothetical protein